MEQETTLKDKVIKGLIYTYMFGIAAPVGIALEIVKIPYYVLDKLANKKISKGLENLAEIKTNTFKMTNFKNKTLDKNKVIILGNKKDNNIYNLIKNHKLQEVLFVRTK